MRFEDACVGGGRFGSLWASAPPYPLGPLPPSMVNQGTGTPSPPGVSFLQPVSQDVAGFLPLCGQTLVGSGMKEIGPEAFGQLR